MKVCNKCGVREDAEGVTLHKLSETFGHDGQPVGTVDLCNDCAADLEKIYRGWLASTSEVVTQTALDAALLECWAESKESFVVAGAMRDMAGRIRNGYKTTEPEGDE